MTWLPAVRWTSGVPLLAVVVLAPDLEQQAAGGHPRGRRRRPGRGGARRRAPRRGRRHRVGEPFGSLVLAVAVTVIEVALIVTLMVSGGGRDRHAGPRHRVRRRDDHLQRHRRAVAAGRRAAPPRRGVQPRGHRARALATVATLATLSLVLPTFTTSRAGPGVLAAAAGLRRGRLARAVRRCSSSCRPSGTATTSCRSPRDGAATTTDEHADPPSNRAALASLGLLLVALVAVVGLAKVVSPTIEAGVDAAGAAARRRRRGHRPAGAAARDPRRRPRRARATASRPASTWRSARPWPASA